jgi:hypothetical protein
MKNRSTLRWSTSILILVELSFSVLSPTTSYALTDPLDLTGTASKSWTLYSTSNQVQCSPSIQSDNTYTFFVDGTFEFDHGSIIEDSECRGDNCCSDLVNLVGTWQFVNGQSHIKVTADHEKGNSSNQLPVTLFDANVIILNENILQLSQLDTLTNEMIVFEFRKK